MAAPVERKVYAGSAGAAVTAVLIWIFDTYVFNGTGTPQPVVDVLQLAILAAGTFVSGYLAKHTPRTDADARPPA